MAFTATAVLEVQTGGSDANNGGIFDTGVAGFPTDGAATLANTSAPVFTSASYNFVAGDVNAWIYIKSGSNWTAGWYQIASVAANAATLSAAIGAAVLSTGLPTTVVGCATVASPTAATWGIDYSQSASSQITFTDMVIGAGANTSNFTSTLNPVGKNFIGNSINVTSGTGFTVQRVAVVSTSGTTATCDKALGTASSTGGNGRLGGALASPGLASSLLVAGNNLWIKTGTYTITSASTNIAAGCVSVGVGSVAVEGYGTVRGDLGTRPTLLASGISTFTLFNASTINESIFRNFICDGASLTSSRGFNINRAFGEYIHAQNCTNSGIFCNSAGCSLLRCSATGCSTQAAFSDQGLLIACVAYSNTVTGFSSGNTGWLFGCISANNSGVSSVGFLSALGHVWMNCVAYGNGSHGFSLTSNIFQLAQNCIAEANTGKGFSASSNGAVIHNCATYNNTGGSLTITGTRVESKSVTAVTVGSVFTNAAGNDFSLNTLVNQGALLRAAGFPGVFPALSSTGYLDLGAVQHQDIPPFGFHGSQSFAIQ